MLAKKMKHAVLQCMMFLGLIAFLYGCGGGGSSGGSASTNNPVTTTSTTTTATQSPKETSKQHVEKTF